MSENINQTDGEQLFDTDGTEGNPEMGSTTEGNLNLDGEETKGAKTPSQVDRDANRRKQIAVWKARVDSGEVTVADIPHKWLQEAIQQEERKPGSVELDDDLLERKLAEREQRKVFDARMEQLNSMTLTAEQKRVLQSEYEALKKGNKDVKALDAAIRLANLPDPSVEAARMHNMRMPAAGMSAPTRDPDDIENMSEDELVADSESNRRRGGGRPKI